MVVTMGVFLLAGQAYAMSCSMGDSNGHGSMAGDQRMVLPTGNSGQQGAAMQGGTGHQYGATPQAMMPGGAEAGNGSREERMGAGSDSTAQPPATSTAK